MSISLEGATYWGTFASVFTAIATLAAKFFARESVKLKVAIFLFVVIIGIVISIFGVNIIMNNEWTNSPVPSARSDPRSSIISFVGVAFAQTGRWIYCGDYDSSQNRWLIQNVNVNYRGPSDLIDRSFSVNTRLDVYDTLPEFSASSLRWTFGKIIDLVQPQQQVEITETQILGRGRIWCEIR